MNLFTISFTDEELKRNSNYYTQRMKTMTQMLMFVYTLIIFLSLFLTVTNSGMSFLTPFSFFFLSNLSYA